LDQKRNVLGKGKKPARVTKHWNSQPGEAMESLSLEGGIQNSTEQEFSRSLAPHWSRFQDTGLYVCVG